MAKHPLDRVRAIALALPEVTERLSHGAPCFFVRDRRPICYFHDDVAGDGAPWEGDVTTNYQSKFNKKGEPVYAVRVRRD